MTYSVTEIREIGYLEGVMIITTSNATGEPKIRFGGNSNGVQSSKHRNQIAEWEVFISRAPLKSVSLRS